MPSQKRADELYLGKVVTFRRECFRDGSLSTVGGDPTNKWVVVGTIPIPISDVKPEQMVSIDVIRKYDFDTEYHGNLGLAQQTTNSYVAGAEEIETIKELHKTEITYRSMFGSDDSCAGDSLDRW